MQIVKHRRRIAGFLGLQKNILALLAMVILVGLGEKMAERFLPLYLMALGGGAFSIGLLNGLDNLLSALYSFPGGYASDKLGYKRALLLFNLIAMAGYVVVIVIPSWQAVILAQSCSFPGRPSHCQPRWIWWRPFYRGSKRTMGVSLHSLVRRIPMALGPLIGGALIGAFGERQGVRLAFIVALLLAGVSLILQQVMISVEKRTPAEKRTGSYGPALLSTAVAKPAGSGYTGAFL